MDEKALYLIAQFDAETESVLAGYGEALGRQGFTGRQTKGIPYHFTLGSWDIGRESRAVEDMERVLQGMDRIEITLGHIGLFGLDVLFIAPNMNFELLGLQEKFFGGCRRCHPWAAHATLLIDEPETIQRALPVLARHFKPMRATIVSVALYEFFPAKLIKECALRSTEAMVGRGNP